MIFEKDVQELKNSDVVVFNMDGRVPDEGACVEIGIGYALGKECVQLHGPGSYGTNEQTQRS